MIEVVKNIVAPLARRVSLMVSRCTLNLINDSTPTQTAQVEFYEQEVHDNAEVWQQFGFTSVPPKGSEGIALFLGGERQCPLIIATENKENRVKKLKEGEVSIYSACGDSFSFKNKNNLELKTKNLNIKISTMTIQNDSCELIDILSTLCDLLSKDKTNTLLGPQPLLSASQYAILKQKLNSFKSTELKEGEK
ncbi:MAG: phage baseplate assembly protein [Bdellovibrionota bacterium]